MNEQQAGIKSLHRQREIALKVITYIGQRIEAIKKLQRRASLTHRERYYHFCELPGQIRFKAITVFARQEKEGGWFMSVALCVQEDQFDRRVGRQIARRRYFARPGIGGIYHIGDEISFDAVRTIAMRALEMALAK